jgi:hypothetical protein
MKVGGAVFFRRQPDHPKKLSGVRYEQNVGASWQILFHDAEFWFGSGFCADFLALRPCAAR